MVPHMELGLLVYIIKEEEDLARPSTLSEPLAVIDSTLTSGKRHTLYRQNVASYPTEFWLQTPM